MTFKISDICDINSSNLSAKDSYEFINYLDTSNLTEGVIDSLQKLVVGEDKIPSRAKRKVKKNDVLISTVRPNQKHYGILRKMNENLIVSTGFAVLSANEDRVVPEYLYRFLTQDSVTNYLQAVGETSTSTYPSIKPSDIGSLEIQLPSLEEQKVISKILSDLDKKIEVNNQINDNLEKMAQAIFKQWFVDFEFPNEDGEPYKSSGGEMVESELGMIPKGWEVKKIKELPINVTDYVANGSFKSLKDNVTLRDEEDYALYIRNTDLKCKFSSDKKYVDKSSYEFLEKTKLFGYEVIISNVGDVGSVYLCPLFDTPMTLGSNVIMVSTLENNIDLNIFIFRMFKSFIGQHLIDSITGGSAQPKFNKTDFRNIDLIIPSRDILEKYNEIAKNLESGILLNDIENKKVSIVRDTLLPKLMSGEIRVPIEQ